jgi:predicted nucleic acid-binding protein
VIVVDTNIIAYLYLPTEFTNQAERLLNRTQSGQRQYYGVASFAMS